MTIAGVPNTTRILVQEEINTATAKQEILTELVELVWITDYWLKFECAMEAAGTQLRSEPIGLIQMAYLVWLDI